MLNILVPNDYSTESKNALKYAVEFAKQTNSQLILYHAIPDVIPINEIPVDHFYADEQEERSLLLESFQNFCISEQIVFDQTPTAYVNSCEHVADGIMEAVAQTHADIVIMGTHGASGWRRYFWGSNTSQLVTKCHFPVLVIPYPFVYQPIYHIVYASDLQQIEEELDIMVPFSKIFHAVLDVFYFDYASAESEMIMMEAEHYIRKHTYQNIRMTIKKGKLELPIDEQLQQNIDTGNTQIVALFKGEHSWLDYIMAGSNVQKLVMSSTIPVLVMNKIS
jgi:nucleotide-binding universal stress UspA family protein